MENRIAEHDAYFLGIGEAKVGTDGKRYMVFENESECQKYAPKGVQLACFNGYHNAYELPQGGASESGAA